MALHYLTGDAARPYGEPRNIIIAHVVNNAGKWGRGFTASLNKLWPWMAQSYKDGLAERVEKLGKAGSLGQVIYFQTSYGLIVANMVAQNGVRGKHTPRPLSYDALARCLQHVRAEALYGGQEVHMPRIGAGLGGGDWNVIENLIQTHLVRQFVPPHNPFAVAVPLPSDKEVEVFVYTLPEVSP